MGIFSRLILLIYCLFNIGVSLLLLSVFLGVLPEHYWLNELHFMMGQKEAIPVLLLDFVFSLFLFTRVFARSSKPKESKVYTLSSSAGGAVNVDLDAIKRLAEKSVVSIQGVRDVNAIVRNDSAKGINIKLKLMVGAETSVAEVSGLAIQSVREQMNNLLGLGDVPVDTEITDMSNAPLSKKQRVS